MTRLLSQKEYPTKFWTAQDLIMRQVNREAERMIPERPRELKPDTRHKKVHWSETVKAAMQVNVLKVIVSNF